MAKKWKPGRAAKIVKAGESESEVCRGEWIMLHCAGGKHGGGRAAAAPSQLGRFAAGLREARFQILMALLQFCPVSTLSCLFLFPPLFLVQHTDRLPRAKQGVHTKMGLP